MAARKSAKPKSRIPKAASKKKVAPKKKAVSKKKAAPKKKAVAKKKAVSKKSAAAPRKPVKKSAPRVAAQKAAVPKATSRPAATGGKLRVGSKAPSFALRDQAGRLVRSSDFEGRKLLVYFYPKADTPGCTVQSCSVRDHRQDLASLGVAVVGVSPDAPAAQAKFDAKFSLGFPLLADEDHSVAEAFGAWGEKSMYGRKYMGIIRSSFLIDEQGRVAGAWHGVKPEETVPAARALL